MPKYVPPHRREAPSAPPIEGEVSVSAELQKAMWDALSRSIVNIFNRLNKSNVEEIATELFRENIIRGRGIVAQTAMRTQHANPDLTPPLAALLARIHKDCPVVVELLCRRLVLEWNLSYRRKDWLRVKNTQTFLCWLYMFYVVNEGVLFEILLRLLSSERRTDEDIDLASHLFQDSFKALAERCRKPFHQEILPIFRDLLAMDNEDSRLSVRSQTVLENCLKQVQSWEKVKDQEPLLPEQYLFFELDEEGEHRCELELSESYPAEPQLDRFAVDPHFEENEAKYEVLRRSLLGENWELELLEANLEASDEADEEETQPASTDGTASPPKEVLDRNKAPVDKEERRIRKEVYLAIRSSVRADEVVHRLLRSLVPSTEKTVSFMLIECCCEERAYKRIYEMSAERLCKTRVMFQTFFIEGFWERYEAAEKLSLKQVEYTCQLYAHLLRTEAIYWGRTLSVLNILDNNASQRLIIQHLFKYLCEGMGTGALVNRLQRDTETASMTLRLFPVDEKDEALLEKAINLFVAMELGDLTVSLRTALASRKAARKRSREE